MAGANLAMKASNAVEVGVYWGGRTVPTNGELPEELNEVHALQTGSCGRRQRGGGDAQGERRERAAHGPVEFQQLQGGSAAPISRGLGPKVARSTTGARIGHMAYHGGHAGVARSGAVRRSCHSGRSPEAAADNQRRTASRPAVAGPARSRRNRFRVARYRTSRCSTCSFLTRRKTRMRLCGRSLLPCATPA